MSWFSSSDKDRSPITLNVGGAYFVTTVATLKPLAQHPFFGPIVNGKAPKVDGAIVIDDDPTAFRYILNYYRTGSLCLPSDFAEWEMLCKTVERLELKEIAQHIEGSYAYQRYVFRQALPPAVLVQWPPTGASHDEGRPTATASSGASLRITPPIPSLEIDEGGHGVRFEGRVLEDVDQLVMVLMAAYGYNVSHWREREGKVFLTLKDRSSP